MRRTLKAVTLFLGATVCASTLQAATVSDTGVWLTHVRTDLLRFWEKAAQTAQYQAGEFPGSLCNDGSVPVAGVACGGVIAWRASNPEETLVAQSRQVYSYGVAYHMTGDTQYLDLAKAGGRYLVDTFYDANTGLFRDWLDVKKGTLSGIANSQKQAYGLLGLSFLHYLTGDEETYAVIERVSDAILQNYAIGDGSYRAKVGDASAGTGLVYHLDQLNAYQTLLSLTAPSEDRAAYLAAAKQTADYILQNYYDETTGLLKLSSTDPDGAATDYGHTMKAYWFIDQIARMSGDVALSDLVTERANAVLARAYREDIGAWATVQDATGVQSNTADWWSFAELDQFAALQAISDESLRAQLEATQSYWLTHFVDATYGGIFPYVDLGTGTADLTARKHYEWMAGFHAFEHALISYLAAAAIGDEDAVLYFARQEGGFDFSRLAYGLSSGGYLLNESTDDATGLRYQSVSYADLSYGSPPDVPLPATGGLLFGGCMLLYGARRRRRRG